MASTNLNRTVENGSLQEAEQSRIVMKVFPEVQLDPARVRQQLLYEFQMVPELATTPGLNIREVLDGKAEPNRKLLALLGLKRVKRVTAPKTSSTPKWIVESTKPPCDIGMPWTIEENAPRWPDGTRMYHSDDVTLTKAVAEVMCAIHPAGKLDDNDHLNLSSALEDAMYEAGAAGPDDNVLDHCYISMAFLTGVAWARANHITGIPPTEQEPWWSGGLLDIEPERESLAEFRRSIPVIRLAREFDERYPHLKQELDSVELRGTKPSPELLSVFDRRLIEGTA